MIYKVNKYIILLAQYSVGLKKQTYHKFGEIDSLHCALVFFTNNNNMCQIYHFWQPCMSYLPCQSVSMPNAKCRLLGSHHHAAATHILTHTSTILHTGTKQLQPLQKGGWVLTQKGLGYFFKSPFWSQSPRVLPGVFDGN